MRHDKISAMTVAVVVGAICAVTAAAQGPDTLWTKTHGGESSDYGYSIQQTSPDGGYVVLGTTFSFGAGGYDFYLIKTDADGEAEWARTYGGSGTDYGRSIQQTLDGGFIITGYTNTSGAGNYDLLLIKTDSAGVQDWAYTYGGGADDRGYFVRQTVPDSGYIAVGYTETYGSGGGDVFIVRTDAEGGILWGDGYGGTGWDEGWCVSQTFPDSGFIVVGSTSSAGAGGDDVYLMKLNADGDTLWTRTYGGASGDYGYHIQQTFPDSGYVITGNTYSFGAGDRDVYLIKTDAAGDTTWTRTFGGSSVDYGYSVQQTSPEPGYIIAGSTRSFGEGSYDAYIIKTDALGLPLWTRTYGGALYDDAFCVQQTAPDSGYIAVGSTRSFGAGAYDVYVIRTEPVLAGVAWDEPLRSVIMASEGAPNPFRLETLVTYRLHEPCQVDIGVYNVLGQKVADLVTARQGEGTHTIAWDGNTRSTGKAASGHYYLRIEADDQVITRRLLLLR
jgi:hypothetical protein